MSEQGGVPGVGAGFNSTDQHRRDLRYGCAEGPFEFRTRRGHRHRPRVLRVLLPMRTTAVNNDAFDDIDKVTKIVLDADDDGGCGGVLHWWW